MDHVRPIAAAASFDSDVSILVLEPLPSVAGPTPVAEDAAGVGIPTRHPRSFPRIEMIPD